MLVVLPFVQKKGEAMKQAKNDDEPKNEDPKPRSIVLPTYVWEEIEEDAKRCRRSVTKHLEAILVRYYNLESNIELDEDALKEAFHAVSRKRTRVS